MKNRYRGRRASNGGLRALQCFALLFSALPAAVLAAGIVPDGGTATSVSTAANGRQTVNIAPAFSGVSQNTYNSFNVSAAGATLNNTGINARTIVNQVTSTNPSLIEGQISVSGPNANVVLANPNGITVNGGSFQNIGHVALTTGQVSFNDLQIAPGVVQRNVVLNTTSGTIVVGPQGLSGALVGLDLIAKNIAVNGPLTNSFTSPTAYVRLVGGTEQATLNTGLSPTDNANDWLTVQAPATPATANSVAVDITAAGSVTSGRVVLIVTDRGPGVASAGPLNATLGDFTLTSNGSVQISNTTVSVAQNANLQVQDAITLTDTQFNVSNGTATLAASLPVTLTGSGLIASGGISVTGGGITLQPDSNQTGSTIASANSGVVLTSTGDITNIGSLVQGQTRIANDSASLGAVTLNAAGDVLNQSKPSTGLGILFGVNDDVSVTAGGNVINEDARILSNQNVAIAAAGDVNNIVDHSTGVNNGAESSYSNRGWSFLFFTHRNDGFSIDYGELSDPQKLSYITAAGGDVTIHGNNVSNVGGSILADAGNTADTGNISITANHSLLTQAVFTGQVNYNQSCFIFCHSSASSTVQAFGGVIEANTNIDLKAGTQITNTGGMVLALGTLTLDAPKTLAQGVLGYSAINRDNDLKAWFGNAWGTIYASDTGGIFSGGSGQVELTGEGVIDGGAFSAPGGVNAAGGIVTISKPYTQPVTVGAHNHIGLVSWLGL
ncbi:filamentous hemagglutinin N-terminal domain-containing protein [Trinickia violacea]|uniref:Filamentous hemagglutinin N-terminal domain-containing protein n=1 Tax=Trinickia violacea TaxID=2571746 RepID=A0A4P8IYQ8_9BURK|nr:filamentous hemagglutinin N-terminal domain-containing protein [Trinickia violacea]QCP52384.1 filamentous hemagglutinin N-terminal domain-containing protein [Trinickia violacea]